MKEPLLIIGPEAVFRDGITAGPDKYWGGSEISLGKRILRAETVALVVSTAAIFYETGDLGG